MADLLKFHLGPQRKVTQVHRVKDLPLHPGRHRGLGVLLTGCFPPHAVSGNYRSTLRNDHERERQAPRK